MRRSQPCKNSGGWKIAFARQARPQHFIVLRRKLDPSQECANIEPRTANDDCVLAAAPNAIQHIDCVSSETRRRIAFERIQKSDQMMGHRRKLLERRRSRPDRHISINLTGIGADDLGAELMSQLDGELRLSACRASREDEDVRHV